MYGKEGCKNLTIKLKSTGTEFTSHKKYYNNSRKKNVINNKWVSVVYNFHEWSCLWNNNDNNVNN